MPLTLSVSDIKMSNKYLARGNKNVTITKEGPYIQFDLFVFILQF